MPRIRWALTIAALSVIACQRLGQASPEYAQAQKQFTQLYTSKFDDAYTDPAIEDVIALLRQVPGSSVDAPAARDLLKRIDDGRAMLRTRAQELDQAVEVARAPTPGAAARIDPSAFPVAQVIRADAGPDGGGATEPASEMPLAEFRRKWGDCFEPSDPVNVVAVGLRETFAQRAYNRCKDQLPGFQDRIVVVDATKVLAIIPKSAIQHVRVVVDAGSPPVPAEPAEAPPPPP